MGVLHGWFHGKSQQKWMRTGGDETETSKCDEHLGSIDMIPGHNEDFSVFPRRCDLQKVTG